MIQVFFLTPFLLFKPYLKMFHRSTYVGEHFCLSIEVKYIHFEHTKTFDIILLFFIINVKLKGIFKGGLSILVLNIDHTLFR